MQFDDHAFVSIYKYKYSILVNGNNARTSNYKLMMQKIITNLHKEQRNRCHKVSSRLRKNLLFLVSSFPN
jgi:hypothetical protein